MPIFGSRVNSTSTSSSSSIAQRKNVEKKTSFFDFFRTTDKKVTKDELKTVLKDLYRQITRIESTPLSKGQELFPHNVTGGINPAEGELPSNLSVKTCAHTFSMKCSGISTNTTQSQKMGFLCCLYNDLHDEYKKLSKSDDFNMTSFYKNHFDTQDIGFLKAHRRHISRTFSRFVSEPTIMKFLRSTGYQGN